MSQLFNLKSKFWYQINLYFRAAMVAAAVIAFVCVSYMDLTRVDTSTKKEVENTKEAGELGIADQHTVMLDIRG